AAGAVKQFGLKDPSNANRTPKAIARFQQVYNRFNHVVVGSEKMAEIFQQSFGLQADRMLRTGIPRTDFFFDEKTIAETRELLQRNYPIINKKKVILYAPTFRDHELHVGKIALDVTKMYEALHVITTTSSCCKSFTTQFLSRFYCGCLELSGCESLTSCHRYFSE